MDALAFARIVPVADRREARVMESSANVQRLLAAQRERFQLLVEGVRDYAILMLDSEGTIVLTRVAGKGVCLLVDPF